MLIYAHPDQQILVSVDLKSMKSIDLKNGTKLFTYLSLLTNHLSEIITNDNFSLLYNELAAIYKNYGLINNMSSFRTLKQFFPLEELPDYEELNYSNANFEKEFENFMKNKNYYDKQNLKRTFDKTLSLSHDENKELDELFRYSNEDDLLNTLMMGKGQLSEFKSFDDLIAGSTSVLKNIKSNLRNLLVKVKKMTMNLNLNMMGRRRYIRIRFDNKR